MRKLLIILLCSFLFINKKAISQENPFVFSHLKEKDGLSENVINCFLKDSRGILWVGTYNGLNRFDGSHFYVYRKNRNTNSIDNEVVHRLCEDKNGNIWGSTDNGVFCYQPQNNKFVNYVLRTEAKRNYFYNILCDKQGDIWTTCDYSVFKLNKAENKFDELLKLTSHKDSSVYFHIRKNGLQPDPSGNGLWMATRSGIFYYDTQKKSLLDFRNQPGDSLFARRGTSALSLTPSGNMWFFNNSLKELTSFDPSSKKIIQTINVSGYIPSADGATILEDRNHRLWFASITYELLVVDLRNGNKIDFIKHRQEDNRTIANQFFWAAHEDDDGTIWLGTHSGISRCNPEFTIYKEYHLAQKIKELNGTSIHLAEQDPVDKTFWILTRSQLVIHYNPQNEKYELFDLNKAASGIGGIRPGLANTLRFFKDRFIISTYTGAWQIKKGTTQITPYDFLPAEYKDFRCSEVVPDADSLLYFNDGKQVLQWNYITNQTRILRYPPDPSIPTDRTIVSQLVLSADHQLWTSAPNGHIAYKSPDNVLTRIKLVQNETSDPTFFITVDVDKSGNIWVFNKGMGLYCYNPVTQEIKLWDQTDGLPTNRMAKAKVDKEGMVWSMINNKVSVFIPSANRFYNFKIPISEDNLNYTNYISVLANGNIFGTINNDIIEFFPDRIAAVPGKIKPLISQLSIAGKEFNLLNGTKLLLKPDENTLNFRFGLLTDKEIFPFDIEYMLEGAENKWTKATANNEALYNNLSAGNYKFRVRANGSNNAWQTEEAVINFTIKAAFYKTTWFLVLIVTLVTGILIFLYRYRLRQKEKLLLLESKAQMLEKEKVMVMYESLKQQLNPHFLFNSLTSLSGLIETNQQVAGNFLEQMSGIYRYILKNGDNETVSLKDEIEFVQLYINLQQTRFKKGLQVNINVPDDYMHFKIAPVTLQNLIENAIKHNIIDTGSPLVVDIFIEGDYLVVKNNLQKKNVVETSNKKGLAQFTSLYQYLSGLPVIIQETEKEFRIKIPLI
jgi:ligand-binding sensor domain-containing protein